MTVEEGPQHVALTLLPGGVWVSTVAMPALTIGYTGYRFESMVFLNDEDCSELDCTRYDTKEAAALGHERMVTRWTGWIERDEIPDD